MAQWPTLLPGPAEAAVFLATVFVLNATPGVDFLLTVTRTLQGGARSGVAAALGISSGCLVHAVAAAFGLAALLALYPAAFAAIQWAGAAYLLWMAWALLREALRLPPDAAAGLASGTTGLAGASAARAPTAARPQDRSWRSEFMGGVLTNLLNPKVALFFLAFLPQFVPPGSAHKTLSMLLLGVWFVLQGTLFLLGLVALVSRMSRWQASERTRRGLNLAGGLLFVALALRLLAGPAS